MHASREEATLNGILAAVKSRRYTRTRLDRMVMCAFLGITKEMLAAEFPYVRVLAFNDKGRSILKEAKQSGIYRNAGERADHPYWDLATFTGCSVPKASSRRGQKKHEESLMCSS